jgi:hypothetical protein
MAKPVRTVTSSCGIVIIIVSGGRPRRTLHAVFSADLTMTPPFHASGEPAAVIRQDESKYIGDSVGVCDFEADAGARKIEDSAPPRETLYPNRGIIVVRATGRPAIFVILGCGAQASNPKSQATLMLTPDQSLHYLLTLLLQHRRTPYFHETGLGLSRNLNM